MSPLLKLNRRGNMRHPERKIKDKETVTAILERSPLGRIATVNPKGFPVIKPINFVYWNGKIYIHSSTKGEKIRDICRRSRVWFEVDEPIAYVGAKGPACTANYYYRSIIVKGRATLERNRSKKLKILERLMEKYQPEGGYEAIPEEALKKTAIIEISIREMTGKERLG
ncbi:MAG: pyridoxamine 5'-phosphate oxidase family protein [Deltaproteobacteria bacterium]|nr:pyridoxamine 5'-phosphate oxidase family protein [Deltaproteobacteria bacterium]